jgi:hypothetical protein
LATKQQEEEDDNIDFPMQDDQEPQDDFGHIPFEEDDDDEDGTSPAGPRISHDGATTEGDDSLRLSGIGVDDSRGSRGDISIGGLSDSDMGVKRKAPEEENQEEEAPKRPIRKRKRKRRKVVVDNEDTELSTEHIRDMLADTHDLVRKARHPADPADSDDDNDSDYDDENDNDQVGSTRAFYRRLQAAPHPNKVWDQHLTTPFVAKSGELPPAMMRMFTDSYYRALGTKPLYKMFHDGESEQVEEVSDEEDSVEETRKQQQEGTDDDDSEQEFPNDNEEPIGQNMDEEEGQEPQEDGFQVPMDDDDELAPTVVDDEEESDLDVSHHQHARGRDSSASKFSTSEFAYFV